MRSSRATGRARPSSRTSTTSSAGIDAIPAHVFARRFLVLGAQPYDVLKQVVERITAMPDQ